MLWITNRVAVNDRLLNEVAASGSLPDPTLFVYGSLGAFGVVFLTASYLIFGRRKKVSEAPVGDRGVRRPQSSDGLRHLESAADG